MSEIYKASEWKSASDNWYVASVQNLANNSGHWRKGLVIFEMNYDEYIKMLVKKYHVTSLMYDKESDVLVFSWENHNDAHKYLLDINKLARNKKISV